MTAPDAAPESLPTPTPTVPQTPNAIAHLRVLAPGDKANAVIDAVRRFVEVEPLGDDLFELRFLYADPLGAVPVLDVYLRRLKLGGWRECVTIEVQPPSA